METIDKIITAIIYYWNLDFIAVWLENWIISSAQARFLDGSLTTLELSLITIILGLLSTGDWSAARVAFWVAVIGFVKSWLEYSRKLRRDKYKDREDILTKIK